MLLQYNLLRSRTLSCWNMASMLTPSVVRQSSPRSSRVVGKSLSFSSQILGKRHLVHKQMRQDRVIQNDECNLPVNLACRRLDIRARKNFRGCLPQSSLKNLGQIPTVLAISGHLERFSPGPNGPKVGCPIRLFKVICLPTSEPFGPGENLLNQQNS